MLPPRQQSVGLFKWLALGTDEGLDEGFLGLDVADEHQLVTLL
jgi:hypothetical protein